MEGMATSGAALDAEQQQAMKVEKTETPGVAAPAPAASAAGDEDHARGDEEVKVIVLNYGKWKDSKAMSELLRAQGVAFQKVQKARQLSFGFVHFHSPAERDAALPKLQALEWNGEPMEVKAALPKKSLKPIRSRGKHSKRGDAEAEADGDAEANSTADAAPRDVRDVVTPWANVPYEEQLERKEAEMKKVLVKIVRQTRKEFGKKEKRVVQDQRNIARKKRKQQKEQQEQDKDKQQQGKTETEHTPAEVYVDEGKPQYALQMPTWLNSHGSLYIVADDVLYSRAHAAETGTPWAREASAADVTAIVSFGGELVAAKSDNAIYALKPSSLTADGKVWERLCAGPVGAHVTSLASLRGTLLCCTSDGRVCMQDGTGRFAKGEWKQLGHVPDARVIGLHNSFIYAHCPSAQAAWWRAPLNATALETMSFEPFTLPVTQALGVASHNAMLILLQPEAMHYVQDDGSVQATVPLPAEMTRARSFSGFASHKGLCCPMDAIHASPVTEGYRNKCEFSFGLDAQDKPCVGFRLGLFREGSVVVNKPDECVNVSTPMKGVCAVFQDVIETSGIPVYDVKTKTGVWRVLTVRESVSTSDLMVLVQVNPAGRTQEQRDALKSLVVEKLTTPATTFKVSSIFLQEYAGVSTASEDDPVLNVYGSATIEEQLLGMRFSVSPGAFFQVNTRGAEKLYSLVKHHANADEHTLLYDVCCGTGTIGICASKGVGKVVGIEICKAATDDAAVNAKLNGVDNVSFINSKAEDVMKDLLRKKREESEMHLNRVVAIVDPPRAGLHHQVLRALRGCPPVQRIVYVSCNPTNSLVRDALTLCGPSTKSIQGAAFEPVHAVPVDMFPHTPHCEMIIVFDRVKSN